MVDNTKELCPRLIDYLVIVGRKADSKLQKAAPIGIHVHPQDVRPQRRRSNFIGVAHPEILRRYPTDNHKDFELPTDVTLFCQPEGCVTISQPQRKCQLHHDANSFIFMLTDKDSGKTRYGITLNFFLTNERRQHDTTKRKNPNASLTSLCLISHHPFLTTFRDLLALLGQLIDACNFRCNKDATLPRDAVWAALTGHWSMGEFPVKVMDEIRMIEKWILSCLSSPIPVPGKTKLDLEVLPKDLMPVIEFALPDHTRFTLMDFPLHLPIEMLDVETVIKLLTAIMLEYKVVLQSKNYNVVSMCVLALVALMYPLEYMFPVIPLLPAFMQSAEQLLLAPTPFIIGVPASFVQCKGISLPSDVILVDLDTNELTIPDDMQIPQMPDHEHSILHDELMRALGKTQMISTIEEDGQQSGFESNVVLDADEIDVAVRVAMIHFFNGPNVFANFSEHTRTLRLYPRPVVALQVDSFLRSRPVHTEFTDALCKTQSVEYFAESSLCPLNDTYVRVQNGITKAAQVGDKQKWFAETLMPIHFNAYPNDSTLADALTQLREERAAVDSDDEEYASDLDSQMEESVTMSPFSEHAPDFDSIKPLGEVNDVYHAPNKLELPASLSRVSIDSSVSSGRSSPGSLNSLSANNSEVDLVKLAENLAIKSNEKGDFGFDHPIESAESTPVQSRRNTPKDSKANSTASSTPPAKNSTFKMKHFANFGSTFQALNGYAEKSQGMLSQVFSKTAPKAQALREKTRPLAEAAATKMEHGQHFMQKKTNQTQMSAKTQNSTVTAQQQSKNQQTIREACDQIIQGQSIGVFAMPKIKRLLEDESLRELVCQKLNLGLDVRYSEEDSIQCVQLTRAQYKGYLKILQGCLAGLEASYNSPISDGLASLFHVLEIAHTHYWAENDSATTPSSGISSLLGTPSATTPSGVQQSIGQPLNNPKSPIQPQQVSPVPVNVNTVEIQPSTSTKSRASLDLLTGDVPVNRPPPLPPRPIAAAPPLPRRPPVVPPRTDTIEKVDNTVDKVEKEPTVNDKLVNETKPIEKPPEITQEQKLTSVANGTVKGDAVPEKPKTLQMTQKTSTANIVISEPPKHFLYQELINTSNPLWSTMVFWELVFYDMVAKERDIIGMDQEPSELIDRYSGLSDSERKRLELDEDRILSNLLHNMTAFMVMCGAPVKTLQQKIRRLLGKAHIGLIYSRKINQLLDELPSTQSNAIPLRPLGSRLVQKQSFTVHVGDSPEAPISFMEVCDDAIIIRAINGQINERWWYERMVNMTFSPRTKVLCIWRRQNDQVHMHKFYTRKCRQLYTCLKAAMERAAERGKVTVQGRNLGGEFPVHDIEISEGGLLQVRIDGIRLLFANRQDFIELANIKKCNTYGGNMFVLEEFQPATGQIRQRRYISNLARQIAFALHRIFSLRLSLDNCLASLTATEVSTRPQLNIDAPPRQDLLPRYAQRRLSCCSNAIRLQRTRCPNEIRAITTIDTFLINRRQSATASFGLSNSPNKNDEDSSSDLTPTLEN